MAEKLAAPPHLVAMERMTMPDFSHAAMHRLADWPVLTRTTAGQTEAKRLDSRAVAALYARISAGDWAVMEPAEREFANAALRAIPPRVDPA